MTEWQVPEGRRLVWREWDGEAVVYNASSGQTHFLNIVSAEALRQLETGPRTAAGLAAHFRAIMPQDQADMLAGELPELLDNLAELGLVDPCPAA